MSNDFKSLLFNNLINPNNATSVTNNYIPLEDFFKNPMQTNFQISWNAKYIASLRPWNNRLNLFIQNLSNERLPVGDIRQVTFVKERDILSYSWKNDNILLYSKDSSGDENYHLYAVNLITGEERDLTPFNNSKNEIVNMLDRVSET